MGTHGGERRIEPARGETAYFLERTLGEHRIETPIDALAKLVARGFKEEADAVLRREKRRRTLPLLPFKKRAPGRLEYFERTDEALAIARAKPRRGDRVARGERSVQLRGGACLCLFANLPAHRLGNRRHGGEPLRQRLEIKPRAAREDRHKAARPRLRDRARGIVQPEADRKVAGRIDIAEEEMRRLALVRLARSCGEDAQIPINLHRIAIDHDAAVTSREANGERRLARRRRTCDQNRARRIIPIGARLGLWRLDLARRFRAKGVFT